MTSNVGGMDRTLRIVAGALLLALGAFGPLGWWGLIGVVPLATALMRWCPAYTLLGVNTCGVGQKPV
ncbi:YgaP family membrane protein [Falsiroseomonas oryziterrae]|uniref:YgaP family membrane protein n=1 Tax=Falsiroseomonas oryziterrae TaxID=2911368 RepID=UPI001F4597F4|nr:DUF2892 domain-containing protein [Roseomonas sp. NPKOSM-4]